MVTAYSSRTLSYPSDRFPALAGIAESILRTRDVNYLAGIWSHDFAFGLCWRTKERVRRKTGQYDDAAPTWSWASMERSVVYHSSFDFRYGCHIVDYEVAHYGPSRSGKVRSGWIRLKASILSCSIEPLGDNSTITLSSYDAQVRIDDSCFSFRQEREVDYVFGNFIMARLDCVAYYACFIVLRLLEGDEVNEERYSCSREGSRYVRVRFVRFHVPEGIECLIQHQEIIIV